MRAAEKIEPAGLAGYLEIMSKSVFQSGISWRVVESKWTTMREAMHEFDPEKLAALTEPELDELVQDERIIRSRRKLVGTVFNARRMLELAERHGEFHNYLRSHGGFEATLKDVRKQFKFMGDSGTYHFLRAVGEEVPPYEEWCAAHPR